MIFSSVTSQCTLATKSTYSICNYQIKNQNAEAKLTLAPVVNFRDFHSINKDHQFNVEQSHSGNKVRIVLDKNSETPIYMNCSDGRYFKHIDDTFRNMYYLREEERGFEAEENHYVPGVYSINLESIKQKENILSLLTVMTTFKMTF